MNLPAATILGIGAVTPLGNDLAKIAAQLSEPAKGERVLRVEEQLLGDARIARQMRRADRFPRMAFIAALDAWTAAGGGDGTRTGIIVATGLGPHARTFKFLDGILDCGDSSALPTDFSHSVHNAAAAYITEILELRGRSCTLADFEAGFAQAVLLGQCWLAEGACERVLVGAVDELGEVMLRILPRMGLPPEIRVGEGAVFLTLGKAEVEGIAKINAAPGRGEAEMVMRDELPLAREMQQAEEGGGGMASVSEYFGHSASSLAMATLGGLLVLREKRMLGKMIQPTLAGAIDSVMASRRSSNGQMTQLLLRRSGEK